MDRFIAVCPIRMQRQAVTRFIIITFIVVDSVAFCIHDLPSIEQMCLRRNVGRSFQQSYFSIICISDLFGISTEISRDRCSIYSYSWLISYVVCSAFSPLGLENNIAMNFFIKVIWL